MLNAEDRIVQLKIAQQLGIHVPETIVTSSSIEATQLLGPRFVVKPLVGGYYWTEEGPRAVFTSAMDESEASTLDFGSAPFVAQEMLLAKTHLRVVTVGEEAWVSSLDAEGRPLDWREQDEAHFSWAVVDDKQACKHALRLAKALGVGYSSQDWISDGNDLTFLDLNPGGQWLFLPDPLAQRVTEGVARFLCGGR